jgi:hypothetical protein
MISLIHPHNQEMFEDIKGVIRRRTSQKETIQCPVKKNKRCYKTRKLQNDRQYNVKIKRTNVL